MWTCPPRTCFAPTVPPPHTYTYTFAGRLFGLRQLRQLGFVQELHHALPHPVRELPGGITPQGAPLLCMPAASCQAVHVRVHVHVARAASTPTYVSYELPLVIHMHHKKASCLIRIDYITHMYIHKRRAASSLTRPTTSPRAAISWPRSRRSAELPLEIQPRYARDPAEIRSRSSRDPLEIQPRFPRRAGLASLPRIAALSLRELRWP